MTTLADALDALVATARAAGLDEAAARAEGEVVAATVSERSRGAFVAWSEQTGRAVSAEEHQARGQARQQVPGRPDAADGRACCSPSPPPRPTTPARWPTSPSPAPGSASPARTPSVPRPP
ncbi:hypothetical protein [Nocardioides convexus]|uniref:hypothetical protein n=1 Tax=Nocardioides convexus TaxID=2712224 RepID=UPI0024184DF8|nr:hypothetical protein [Nocardioides convexus]